MHKSHYFPSNTNLGRSEIFNKILNDDFSWIFLIIYLYFYIIMYILQKT